MNINDFIIAFDGEHVGAISIWLQAAYEISYEKQEATRQKSSEFPSSNVLIGNLESAWKHLFPKSKWQNFNLCQIKEPLPH